MVGEMILQRFEESREKFGIKYEKIQGKQIDGYQIKL